ncbi:MAG: O-antigen ligase family protein [Bacteroidales bacterium]|nr:O-antigen ligase family protein [Bacteroidales bacterium]
MKNAFHIYQHYIGIVNYVLFLLMLISIPFPSIYLKTLWPIWLVSWALEFRFLQPENKRIHSGLWPIVIGIGFLLWCALSICWSDNPYQGWKEIERNLSLLVLPLIAIYGVNERYKMHTIQTVLFAVCVASVLFYMLIYYFCSIIDILQYYPYCHWWSIMAYGPMDNLKHHGFYGIELFIALSFSGSLYTYYKSVYSKASALLTIGIADIILLFGCFTSGSRTTILLIPIFLFVAFLLNYHSKHKAWIISAVLGIMVIGGGLLTQLPRMQEVIQGTQKAVTENQIDEQSEPRIYIYKTILANWKDYGLFGMGIGTPQFYLRAKYQADPAAPAKALQFGWHPHNQYFNAWMSIGPIGMLALLGIVICLPLFYHGIIKRQAIYLSLNYGWAMLTDMMISFAHPLYTLFIVWIILALEERELSSSPLARP